jgi:phosphoribosylanthranilate isomerase
MIPIKICGLRNKTNVEEILSLKPAFIGFIFHPNSPRYVNKEAKKVLPQYFPVNTKKVGVFVNAPVFELLKVARDFGLDYIQLHGDESPAYANHLHKKGFRLIKAFPVGHEKFDFQQLAPYTELVDYFLFDTKGKAPGGNGQTFNWSVLNEYPFDTPFFLSGGIGPEHTKTLQKLSFSPLHALDLNSKFETQAGIKDLTKLKHFQQQLALINNQTT